MYYIDNNGNYHIGNPNYDQYYPQSYNNNNKRI